jgi:hypothetical protein
MSEVAVVVVAVVVKVESSSFVNVDTFYYVKKHAKPLNLILDFWSGFKYQNKIEYDR